MSALLELIHAAQLSAVAAVIDVDRLVVQLLCIAPAAVIALWVAAAWFFLSDQPRQRYR